MGCRSPRASRGHAHARFFTAGVVLLGEDLNTPVRHPSHPATQPRCEVRPVQRWWVISSPKKKEEKKTKIYPRGPPFFSHAQKCLTWCDVVMQVRYRRENAGAKLHVIYCAGERERERERTLPMVRPLHAHCMPGRTATPPARKKGQKEHCINRYPPRW